MRAFEIPCASFYRRQAWQAALGSSAAAATDKGLPGSSSTSPRALKPEEHQAVLAHMHSERFVDRSPREVYATSLSPTCEVRVLGYLPIADMLALCRRVMVNCYLTCDQTFHHKVVELLCCGRPILCFPADQAEALTLTQRVGGDLRSCTSPADIVNGLVHAEATLNAPAGPRNERLRELTWGAQAQILDRVLLDAVSRRPRA